MSIDDAGDAALVTGAYQRCWLKSRGRYNRWIEGNLTEPERSLYIAVNATERVYASGFDGLLADGRFTLAESADALEQVGVPEQAVVLRQFGQDVNERALPRTRSAHRDVENLPVEVRTRGRLQAAYWATPEPEVYRRAAEFIRRHSHDFSPLALPPAAP